MRLIALAWCLALAACGGSSGSGSTAGADGGAAPAPLPVPALQPQAAVPLALAAASFEVAPDGVGGDAAGDAAIAGWAGNGLPLANVRLALIDSKGVSVTGRTDAGGAYLLRFQSAQLQPPFLVRLTDATGEVLASLQETAVPAGQASPVNINPLTDKIVSDLLVPGSGGTDVAASGAELDITASARVRTDLLASIQDAIVAAGFASAAGFDPVRTAFRHDATGVAAVVDSLNAVRDAESGRTQLRAKFAPLVTQLDGSVTPTVVSSASPLAPAQVALSGQPGLTSAKLRAWLTRFNQCLARVPGSSDACGDRDIALLVSPAYKARSRDFAEDFSALYSGPARTHVQGATLRNPRLHFLDRASGVSTVDDVAVVDVTISQPGIGPLTGNPAAPVEYTKQLVFRRDDTTPGLAAGNWILLGDQKRFDWSVGPGFFFFVKGSVPVPAFQRSTPSSVSTGIHFDFQSRVFDPVTRSDVASGIAAVRVQGPGLPPAGVVLAPASSNKGVIGLVNDTGEIAFGGYQETIDYPLQSVDLSQRTPITGCCSPNAPTSVAAVGAHVRYLAQIFFSDQSFVFETVRTTAPLRPAAVAALLPLHDLTPSAPINDKATAVDLPVSWRRNPESFAIDAAFRDVSCLSSVTFSTQHHFESDSITLAPTVTSIAVPGFPAKLPQLGYNLCDPSSVGLLGHKAGVAMRQTLFQ